VANLTVVIDDEVLRRARKRALDEGTSVNAVVRERLETYASEDEARAALDRVLAVSRASTSRSGPGGRSWTRDDLYDRWVLRDRS
jgi:hypothetical protein